jgi:hypothetical protein
MDDNPLTRGQDDVLNRLNALLNRDKVEAATKPAEEPIPSAEREVPLLVNIVEYGQAPCAAAETQPVESGQNFAPGDLREVTDRVQDAIVEYLRPMLEAAARQALVDLRPRLEDLVRQSMADDKRSN